MKKETFAFCTCGQKPCVCFDSYKESYDIAVTEEKIKEAKG